jgi:hypothetical protein
LLEAPSRRQYKLLQEIAKGGWAVVVRAWDRLHGSFVGMKARLKRFGRFLFAFLIGD